MKFGKYLQGNTDPLFRGAYVDYGGMKECIKRAKQEFEQSGASIDDSRLTSITVTSSRGLCKSDVQFFDMYEKNVKLVSETISRKVQDIRTQMKQISEQITSLTKSDTRRIRELTAQADELGDRFLRIEKYVNLNYLGLHKILKKHDKNLPHAQCRPFYLTLLHKEDWLAGNYSDVLVRLSHIYSQLRFDASGVKNEDSAQGFVRSTTKFWVTQADVSSVKYKILQHLPVFQFDKDKFAGDAQLINSVYLDNSSAELYHGRLDKRPGAIAVRLRWYGAADPTVVFVERKTHLEGWKGESSVKERFVLEEKNVLPFLNGKYTLEQAVADLREKGRSSEEIENFSRLFSEVQRAVDSKQLRPMVRTQYMRAAFQIPFDATVRISLDTNLVMLKENVNDGQALEITRWRRDPELRLQRMDVTHFPHSVLEVKLSLPEGETAPAWVGELISSGLVHEVHKFSKFIHGTCTLFPEIVQAVPYWVDDESVRKSMLESSALPPNVINEAHRQSSKRRTGIANVVPERHPILGDQPTLRLLQGTHGPMQPTGPVKPTLFDVLVGANKPRLRTTPLKIEPKTFFANERTFLNWLHMAVTIGSISSALLGFAATADREGGKAARAQVASVEVICLILLPLAVVLCFYALFLFIWRSKLIAFAKEGSIDDRRGPLVLACVVVMALTTIFVISVRDLIDTMAEQEQGLDFFLSSFKPRGM